MICPVVVIQTESRRALPDIRMIPVEGRGGYRNPRMSNVNEVAGAATERLYRVMKFFTGTTVMVEPLFEVITVTHIVLPLNQSVDVRPFCTAAARAVAIAAVISSRAAVSLFRWTTMENFGMANIVSSPTITTTMSISGRV
jgi:hypothetical protein